MKSLGYLAVFMLSAAGIYMGLSRRQQNNDLTPAPVVASATSDELTWDRKNRRPVDSVFFIKVPAWMRGSQGEAAPDPAIAASKPAPSEVHANPFSE